MIRHISSKNVLSACWVLLLIICVSCGRTQQSSPVTAADIAPSVDLSVLSDTESALYQQLVNAAAYREFRRAVRKHVPNQPSFIIPDAEQTLRNVANVLPLERGMHLRAYLAELQFYQGDTQASLNTFKEALDAYLSFTTSDTDKSFVVETRAFLESRYPHVLAALGDTEGALRVWDLITKGRTDVRPTSRSGPYWDNLMRVMDAVQNESYTVSTAPELAARLADYITKQDTLAMITLFLPQDTGIAMRMTASGTRPIGSYTVRLRGTALNPDQLVVNSPRQLEFIQWFDIQYSDTTATTRMIYHLPMTNTSSGKVQFGFGLSGIGN